MSYIDLQVNGYVGIDFNDPEVTVSQVHDAARAMVEHGVVAAYPTVITASVEAMCQCVKTIVAAIKADERTEAVFRGLHIEGPFLSKEPGYIGAHPVQHARASSIPVLERICDAAEGQVAILTLSPEVDVDGELTRFCVSRGILVAAGHTDASTEDLARCCDSGLSMFTHLGNGCPRLMDRHDNIIYRALQFRDRLSYSLIADSFHVPELLFRHLLDFIPNEKIVVVSDAICAAGLGPGEYRLGDRTVRIGPDKAARDPSGEHFVGAASTMRDADSWLEACLELDAAKRKQLMYENAKQLLDL